MNQIGESIIGVGLSSNVGVSVGELEGDIVDVPAGVGVGNVAVGLCCGL